MKVSCLMPIYNRATDSLALPEEAIESFLRQDYPDKELLVCNDTPGQQVVCDSPNVRVFNVEDRIPSLSDKIQFMVERAEGDLLCRWDDDDISLPHRLKYSVDRLEKATGKFEWRATNYWFFPVGEGKLHYVNGPGNTHIMSLWHRDLLAKFPNGIYPPKMSGWEDQAFNRIADETNLTTPVEVPAKDIYYLYRWGVSDVHLSGRGGSPLEMQSYYESLGERPIECGEFEIKPHWKMRYDELALRASEAYDAKNREELDGGSRPRQ